MRCMLSRYATRYIKWFKWCWVESKLVSGNVDIKIDAESLRTLYSYNSLKCIHENKSYDLLSPTCNVTNIDVAEQTYGMVIVFSLSSASTKVTVVSSSAIFELFELIFQWKVMVFPISSFFSPSVQVRDLERFRRFWGQGCEQSFVNYRYTHAE